MGDYYPVAIRNMLEVSKPYDDAKYKIVKDANNYHLVNMKTLSVVYTSATGRTLLGFVKNLITDNYIVKVRMNDDRKDT